MAGRLIGGEYGLFKTWWLFGIGGTSLLHACYWLYFLTPRPLLIICAIFIITIAMYKIAVLFGMWRAASRYRACSDCRISRSARVGISIVIKFFVVLVSVGGLAQVGKELSDVNGYAARYHQTDFPFPDPTIAIANAMQLLIAMIFVFGVYLLSVLLLKTITRGRNIISAKE